MNFGVYILNAAPSYSYPESELGFVDKAYFIWCQIKQRCIIIVEDPNQLSRDNDALIIMVRMKLY